MVNLSVSGNLNDLLFQANGIKPSSGINNSNSDYVAGILAKNTNDKSNSKESIEEKNSEILEEQLNNTKKSNGCITSAWNKIKTTINVGMSDKECDKAIEDFKNGKIDFEEANNKIKEYTTKQDESLNLISNISASVAALGVAALAATSVVATFGASAPLVIALVGAGAGAITKSGLKIVDRATNDINGDALNSNQILRDGLSGAVAGAIATVTMGTAASAPTITAAVKNCGIVGVKTGSVSCGTNYILDCEFDKNKKFKAEEFARTTLEGAVLGGTVGAIMGGANSTMHLTGALKNGCNYKIFIENAEAGRSTTKDLAANSVCSANYKILNDKLSPIIKS